MRLRPSVLYASLLFAVSFAAGATAAAAETAVPASNDLLSPLSAEVTRARVLDWVGTRTPSSGVLDEIARMWVFNQTPSTEALFDLTIQTFGKADAPTQHFLSQCRLQEAPLVAPDLKADGQQPFYESNLRVFFGRYLVQREMYDEALEVMQAVDVHQIIDPAALLFARAVCQHQLLMKTEGLATLETLLKRTEAVPMRYSSLATLMQFDLEQAEGNPLDGISRKMSDVERRLKLGRGGERVQKKEDEVIAELDELIKKIEDQQGGGGGSGSGSSNSNKSSSPADEARVKGATAPGNVDQKKLSKDGAWGKLPPKDREKAKDLVGRDFPSYYKDAVEAFTRKQAERQANAPKK